MLKCDRCQRFSPLEVLLSTLVLILALMCISLIIVSWFTLEAVANEDMPDSTDSVLNGQLLIVNGAVFTDDLRNRSSVQFKALAFDTEGQITKAFEESSLKQQFRKCHIQDFSNGSIFVNFDLHFHQIVDPEKVQAQLVAGLQSIGNGAQGGLVIDLDSIQVSVMCPDGQKACADGKTCIPLADFCDGIFTCVDGSDESEILCATQCDGQYLLLGPVGSFHSENFPLPYESDTQCRWAIRVQTGLAIRIEFQSFHTEEDTDTLKLYEGTGPQKILTYELSGISSGFIRLFTHEATVEFSSDFINNLQGFNATYEAENISHISDEQKVNCSFEKGWCFWRQELEDAGDWVRSHGSTFPPFTGPSFDHTLGNQSGFYIVTPGRPGNREKIFRVYSLPLASLNEPVCLRFWYHMFGEDVRRLRVLAEQGSVVTVIFQKEGNYGDQWNYGQVMLTSTAEMTVIFEAQKTLGMLNDIALDDISLTCGPCGEAPPDPTLVPQPTTPPPVPSDCGGPFDLWEPNSTFSSPNYPHGYGAKLTCLWTLHANKGLNIQLHFQDFDLEATYDIVEVRDGTGLHSELLGVFTGEQAFPDLYSKTSLMTVMLFTDSSGGGRGFHANFTTGAGLGEHEPCPVWQYQCLSGDCVHSESICDRVMDCPDSSDERDCVHMVSVNGSDRLRLQVKSSLYTACAENWSPNLTTFLCRYLGYKAGNASSVAIAEEDYPVSIVELTANGTLLVKPSEKCPREKVVSLHCDNQPCGKRKVALKRGQDTYAYGQAEKQTAGERGAERGESPEKKTTGRVVGGSNAEEGAWPWMVSLHWRGRHVCGASLIDREWLVTAAHCVYGKNVHLSNWAAMLGLHSQFGSDFPNRQIHQVDKIIINKLYNRRTKDADIALIRLHTQANLTDYIQPICLPQPSQMFEAGRRCVISGWGREAEQGSVADVLQEAVVPLLNRTQCQDWLPDYTITKQMLCAGYMEGGVDSCQGDSGGPLMCEQDDGWVLAGVTSFGVGCGRPQRPGVYALVSKFTDWVVETRRLFWS
ncbi:enteropeptidase [Chanos chanos]|uniref:Enteropeptidase n=1 Tax=Chanos chanos TaxID=29144 RepID=A0A6J2UP95_CHACN|nr:enteropeptidase [Chanos chanos]